MFKYDGQGIEMKMCDLRNIKFDPSCKMTTKINEIQEMLIMGENTLQVNQFSTKHVMYN